MIKPRPCPFCGKDPTVEPQYPERHGDTWGMVRCINLLCPANPSVEDGISISDDRGSNAYKLAAIERWNARGRTWTA